MDWKKYLDKAMENLLSYKWWVFVIATLIFVQTTKLSEWSWVGIAGGVVGGRIFEYFTGKKNGNGK